MRKLTYSALTAVLCLSFFTLSSIADPGDLFITVDLNEESDQQGCSILKVDPRGNLSIFLTDDEIRAATGLEEADCDDVAIACDLNGDIYFSEDFSPGIDDESRILKGGPAAGTVSLFTTNDDILAGTGEGDANLEKGLTFGPDGNLYATDDASDSVLQITVPGSDVSIAVPETQIELVSGEDAELDGGVAVDEDLNIYVVDEESDNVFTCRPGGPCSILTAESQLEDVAGVGDVELNEAILLVGDLLYVAEDSGCNCIFVINIRTGIPQVFLSETQMEAVLGVGLVDPEGGLAVDHGGRIYIGNDSEAAAASTVIRTGLGANPNQLSIFVSRSDVLDIYPDNDSVEFDGGMCITPIIRADIPTLSEWGMLAMAGVLGLVGLFFALRRRALSA